MPRALLSVSDKTGLIDFARALAARGFELVSTGGTARALGEARLPVLSIASVTGFPEMMDGRVKTLHPLVHGGILARRSQPDDMAAASQHGITLIDLVAVNLYPFAQAAADPATPFDTLIEEIDVGGPSLVRAAAKNFQDVLVVVSPGDYAAVLDQLDREQGPSRQFRFDLARKAFAHTSAYDSAIAAALGAVTSDDTGFTRARDAVLPPGLVLSLEKVRDLRYGENPHQPGALYRARSRPGFELIQGKELSYNNLLDLDAATRIVTEFDTPAAAVVKHANPCGVATGGTTAAAYVHARDADALSAFGGIVGLNQTIDADTARHIVSTFIEAVIAPDAEDQARTILATKANLRVVLVGRASGRTTSPGGSDLEMRSIFGGLLVQVSDAAAEAYEPWSGENRPTVATKRQPTDEEWRALQFAWRVCAHVRSNAVIFTRDDRTMAIGAGQMSRVDAVKVAQMKAQVLGGNALAGTVAASDAFFPFRDGLDAVAAAGATAVVQPGGSVRDAEVIAAADEHGLAMVFTGVRHFRH